MSTNYNVYKGKNGVEHVLVRFTWFDDKGDPNYIESHDLDSAAEILGLLRGETCLGDLEP
jgi:hypothetical protein